MEPIIIEERFGAFQFAVPLILAYDFGTLHRNKVLKIKMVSKFQDKRFHLFTFSDFKTIPIW